MPSKHEINNHIEKVEYDSQKELLDMFKAENQALKSLNAELKGHVAALKQQVAALEIELLVAEKSSELKIKRHKDLPIRLDAESGGSKRSRTTEQNTAEKHDKVRTEYKNLIENEGLSKKDAIKQLQAWIDAEDINRGGYDVVYLKKTILGLK